MQLTDLTFKQHGNWLDSTHATVFFDNGYGASVITGSRAYTSESAPYELAVLKGTEEDNHITYDTPITNNVLGHLTESDVNKALSDVSKLPS